MAEIGAGHRKVNPGRESTGTDFYTVLRYDPIWQQCDIAPASTNQRGILKAVPIVQPWGGAWELQIHHDPKLERTVNPDSWGTCPRGPRWGVSLPIQEGDMARVSFAGEGQSDPVIIGFMRWRGDYGIPWVANQVLGNTQNDYTEATPEDDDILEDRFDILMPSGSWARCGESGSWVIATAPTHRAVAWASLGYDGKIKIKSRDDDSYKIHVELDPVNQEGRIAVGPLEESSFIEFKGGNIRIKAQGDIRMFASSVEVNCTGQSAPSALVGLQKLDSHLEQDSEVADLLTTAVGELTIQSEDPLQAKNTVLNNGELDPGIKGQVQDLALRPQNLSGRVAEQFTPGLDDTAIAQRLTRSLGADVLNGNTTQITSSLDLQNRGMAKELGFLSWDLADIQQQFNETLPPATMTLLNSMPESGILEQLSDFAGNQVLRGKNAPEARTATVNATQLDIRQRVLQVIGGAATTPINSTVTGAGGQVDALGTVARRLGQYVLKGNNQLGGQPNVFDRNFIAQLNVPDEDKAQINKVADQIEQWMANPYQPIKTQLTPEAQDKIATLYDIPPEIRDAIAATPREQWSNVRELAATDQNTLQNNYVFNRGGSDKVAQLIGKAPEAVVEKLQEFEALEVLGQIPEAPEVVVNPATVINTLPAAVIRSFAGAALGAGIFHVRVANYALFTQDPVPAEPLEKWPNRQYHYKTVATEIERFVEYGPLDMPDYWG